MIVSGGFKIFRALGCYASVENMQNKFLGPLVADYFDMRPNYSMIQWECSKKAVENGHPLFGIEYHGQCFTSEEVDLSIETRTDSWTYKFGVGSAYKVFVFRIVY